MIKIISKVLILIIFGLFINVNSYANIEEINKVKKQLESIETLYENNAIDKDEYDKIKTRLIIKKNKLENQNVAKKNNDDEKSITLKKQLEVLEKLLTDGNFLVNGSGSFTQLNIGATTNTFDAFFNLNPASTDQNIFLIQSGSFQSVKVNSTGVVNLGGFESEPTYVSGGFYYNSNENEFYLGV